MPHLSNAVAGPSRAHHHEDRRERKRKDISSKLGKEMNDRRDDGRQYAESLPVLVNTAMVLSSRPEASPLFQLRMLPLTIERAALLAQLECEERNATDHILGSESEERSLVEAEWTKGRDIVRERLLEGLEERRRRARDEKESETGISGDATLDPQSRPHITRKLRGNAPSRGSTPVNGITPVANGLPNGTAPVTGISSVPITSGPFLNPHSLNVDELPSPFPLPLTSNSMAANGSGIALGVSGHASYGPAAAPNTAANASAPANGTTTGPGRRRPKGSGTHQSQAIGGLGKSLVGLSALRDIEVDEDLSLIRRGSKRNRNQLASSHRMGL
ncbi:hypothetical protein DL96DRAFT_687941 [Flagelloscypha sp. PMI_526]|nr:hypothetical protein DL96DRAFT_687941 [Flagelloscypha sp. PMI_526]